MKGINNSDFRKNLLLHLLFVPFFLLALSNYQERVYFEQASDIFWLLNIKSFYFVHNRFILFFSQWLPLLAIHLKLSLRTVLILLSIGNVLFFYLLFVFSLHYLKNRLAALGILLSSSIVILFTFFNTPMAEIWFGTALLFVFHAMVHSRRYRNLPDFILFFIITFLTAHSHPAMLMLVPFVLLFDFLENGRKSWFIYLFILAIMVLGLFNVDEYSTEAILGHYNPGNINYAEYTDFNYLKNFVFFLFYRYGTLMFLMIITILYYLSQLRWRKLLLLLVFFSGYTLIMSVVAGIITNSNSGGLEIYYIPLAVVVGIPFLYDFYRKLAPVYKTIMLLLLAVMIGYRFYLIHDTSKLYTEKVELIKRIIDHSYQFEGSKFYVRGENISQRTPMVSWWTWPVESMVLSALNGKDKTVNITPVEVLYYEKYLQSMNDTSFRWLFGEPREYHYLNSDYFSLKPGPYVYLNHDKPLRKYFFQKVKLKIQADTPVTMKKFSPCSHICCYETAEFLPIKILNQNNEPLSSGLANNLYISYQWIKDQQVIKQQNILTPVEVDVIDSYEQFIAIQPPSETGDYVLKVDFLMTEDAEIPNVRFKRLRVNAENLTWLDISQSIPVTIVN